MIPLSLVARTVKACNFGADENLEPLFKKCLLSSKRVLQNIEENKSCTKTIDLQIRFCSFFLYMIHPKMLPNLQKTKKGQTFP
jgi:hypothetical protein